MKRILIVEDDDFIREGLELTLGYAGYEVVAAANGFAALAMVGEGKPAPAAALVDWCMPEMSGESLVNALQSSPRTAHVPIVVLSALSSAKIAGVAGVARVLEKPINPERLVRVLEEVCGNDAAQL